MYPGTYDRAQMTRQICCRLALLALLGLLAIACGAGPTVQPGPELPSINSAQFETILAETELPVVVNVWASWCIPCRSEAPLLREAHSTFGDSVQFVGISVADDQSKARAFIAEFGIEFDNYFDRPRAIPGSLGRVGVPITFFFAADGTLVSAHSGVIDERTLAVNIDELLAR